MIRKFKTENIVYLFLFFLGFIFWHAFLNISNPILVANDWINFNLHLDTMRLGFKEETIPWFPSTAYGNNKYFLANPELVTTPDILLIKYLSNSLVIYIHIMILYVIGFYSLLLISKKYDLSVFSFMIFYLLFNYNGYILTHISAGHFTWTGYYLIPLFIYNFNEFLESRLEKYLIYSSIIMGVLYLNGSFHISIFLCLFLLFCVIWHPGDLFPTIKIIVFGVFIGISKILPALIFFKHDGRLDMNSKFRFITGYPDVGTLLDALLVQRNFSYSLKVVSGELHWHEYSIYIGLFPFISLSFGVYYVYKNHLVSLNTSILLGGFFMLLMAFENTYSVIANAPLPFVGIERISTRFIVIPYLIFLISGIIGLDKFLKIQKVKKIFLSILLFFTLGNLYTNLIHWRISVYNIKNNIDNSGLILLTNREHYYSNIIYLSWTISFLALFLLLFKLKKGEFRYKVTFY